MRAYNHIFSFVLDFRSHLSIIIGPEPWRMGIIRIAIAPLWLDLSTDGRLSISSSLGFANEDADDVDKIYDTSNDTVSNLALA